MGADDHAGAAQQEGHGSEKSGWLRGHQRICRRIVGDHRLCHFIGLGDDPLDMGVCADGWRDCGRAHRGLVGENHAFPFAGGIGGRLNYPDQCQNFAFQHTEHSICVAWVDLFGFIGALDGGNWDGLIQAQGGKIAIAFDRFAIGGLKDRSIRMKISTRGEYALRALILLGQHPTGILTIAEIAERTLVPDNYLEQILLHLKHLGYVKSKRGVHGGYSLRKKPNQIVIGEVIRQLEGPLAPMGCVSLSAYEPCELEKGCLLKPLWLLIRETVAHLLENTTLEDLLLGRLQEASKGIKTNG